MDEGYAMMLYLTIYKVATLLAGLAFTFMGYKLFIRGIFTEAGELQTDWENRSLVLKKAAPGTFFALFGTIIVCVSLWRGLSFSNGEELKGIGVSPAVSSPTSHFQADATRNLLHGEIAVLNTIPANLRQDLPDGQRYRLEEAIRRTKVALMESVWTPDWGDPIAFKRWVQNGEPDPVPDDLRKAAEYFRFEGSAK